MSIPKIYYLAWTEPSRGSGACLAMYRHFVIKKDFEVYFATDKELKEINRNSLYLVRNRIQKRLSRTRFRKIIAQYEMTIEPYLMMRRCYKTALEFKPEVIFTIPDNTLSWAAYLLAKRLNKPLVTNFQDWWPRGQFWAESERPYRWVRNILEKRFRTMYAESVVAFCTSEGMKEYLGPHPNAPILYPCPAFRNGNTPSVKLPKRDVPLKLIYAGTIVRFYGKKILELAKALHGNTDVKLEIYGHKPDWSQEDLKWAVENNYYLGYVRYEELEKKLNAGDVFIVIMSHAPEVEIMMRTSFTTKFLEYTQFAKPVIVWGPDYCEPVKLARKHDIALTETSESPGEVIKKILMLKNPGIYEKYGNSALTAATSIFDPENIHGILKNTIYALLRK